MSLSTARGYLEEASWLIYEAVKKMWEGDKPLDLVKQKSLLSGVRGKIMTARQFIDLHLKAQRQEIVSTSATNYTYVTNFSVVSQNPVQE